MAAQEIKINFVTLREERWGQFMRGICGRRQRHRFKAMRKLIFQFGLSLAFLLALSVAAAGQGEGGRTLKWKVAIGRFSNETQYGKGIFYERENDPMAKQAYDILAAKLVASNKFILLERADADKLSAELNDGGESNRLAADYLILGSITEFGRKITGKDNLFTATKTQTVEAGVAVRLVDVVTGVAIYSEEAKGFAETTSKSTLGLGGKMGFDATLSDKAISSAVDQLVENIINKCSDKPWRTYIISADSDGVIIAGGASQGLRVGDVFDVMMQGKKVKNPQTGMMLELPGKRVGSVTVEATLGDSPLAEFSVVSVTEGAIDAAQLAKYYVQEVKRESNGNEKYNSGIVFGVLRVRAAAPARRVRVDSYHDGWLRGQREHCNRCKGSARGRKG